MAVKVKKDYDFSGYVTKNDIRCSDGRTIRHNAFAACDGKTVPLVWNHGHQDMRNVIGHVRLENRDDGVYGYGYLNHTDMGDNAREQIRHGDITSMSIYANHLKEMAGNVVHGIIREVSLVLAGANDGAIIDEVLEHGDYGSAAVIYPFMEEDFLYHGDDDDYEAPDSDDDYEEPDDNEEEDEMAKNEERTVGDVLDTLNEEQAAAVNQLLNDVLSDDDDEDDDEYEDGDDGEYDDEYEEEDDMKHNVFDSDTRTGNYLSHADEAQIIADAKRNGSLKEAFLAHCESLGMDEDAYLQHDDSDPAARYGIDHIEALFPEYKELNNTPEWVKRDTTWVPKVLNGAHHIPFSRIKSRFANITEDEARAKGYIKGHMKKEEVFSLLKRATEPCTVYKKQKLDRDDQIDITDFDVVAWIKAEMRMMLDEELARAILIGDGRLASDEDHIPEDHIRPIWKEADFFAVKVTITMKQGATDDDKAKAFIRACIKARKYYKGSGTPTMFTTEDLISDALLLEDGIGHRLYESESTFATACRVSSIVPVEVMEGVYQTIENKRHDLAAIVVNMSDYYVGADKGGAVSMFEDFDIDYNQNKYLIETRCSGSLVKPYSALVFSFVQGTGSTTTISFSGDGMDEFAITDDNAQG